MDIPTKAYETIATGDQAHAAWLYDHAKYAYSQGDLAAATAFQLAASWYAAQAMVLVEVLLHLEPKD